MSRSYNRCKVCNKLIVSDYANYCSSQCRKLDSKLYYGKITILFIIILKASFLVYAYMKDIPIVYIGLIISGITIMVTIPLYQYYRSIKIERRMRQVYTEQNIEYDENGYIVQPVYIFLYINRNTEPVIPEEDFSEFT